jgi:hypothetical protein
MSKINRVAGGNIGIARFVKQSTAAPFRVLQAGANERVTGISQLGQKYAPIPSNTNYYAAEAADNLAVYGEDEECLLLIGSGGVTQGALIKSDADGKGVLALTTGTTAQEIGAEAMQTASENEYARVKVFIQTKVYPALA